MFKIIEKQSLLLSEITIIILLSIKSARILFKLWHRLIDKYMPQPGLMKMRRTFIDKTCLSSDVASLAFAYFLNLAHASMKYAIQILLIQTAHNPLQALKKLVIVSQVNPLEFFFDGTKQVQVTSSQIS
jgi:hypothetical protein